jgi:CRISPR/Cas system CSM-associated protein Csm3 (group 7 of RAMP superfamily)
MNSTTPEPYVRVRIAGKLICTSDLHVGTGDLELFKERFEPDKLPDAEDKIKGGYNSICLDARGRPYLPGSTLRGFLRAVADEHDKKQSKALACDLFGNKEKSGRVRLYDAFLRTTPATAPALPYWARQSSTAIRHGIAIDPITGTVAEHKLFRHEYVPAGSAFDFELEADEVAESDLALFLGLLAHWDGEVTAAVGKGKTKGQGKLKWELERLEILDQARYQEWLGTDKPLQDFFVPIDSPESAAIEKPAAWEFRFRLVPTAPLLVNEPGYVQKKNKQDDPLPDLEYSRLPDGRPIVPAASLRGLLRGRAWRILATIAVGQDASTQKAREISETIVKELFGSTERRSPIVIEDAVATSPGEDHRQYFNAIDRFAGGVADGKLYSAKAVLCESLEGSIHMESNRMPKGRWKRGLFLLVMRDALEGDLAVGWGKARGYGAFKVVLNWKGAQIDSWQGMLDYLKSSQCEGQAKGWVEALHNHVKSKLGTQQ